MRQRSGCEAWLTQIAVAVCATGFLAGCVQSRTTDEHQQVLAEMGRHMEPLIAAIEGFAESKGRFPQSVDEMIENGSISGAPSLPSVSSDQAKMKYIAYDVGPRGAFYCLRIGYDWRTWAYQYYYSSLTRQWESSKYPPDIEYLTLRWHGEMYQQSSNFLSLAPVLRWVVRHRGPEGYRNFDRQYVTNLIGAGHRVPVDPVSLGSVAMIEEYETAGSQSLIFRFCYRVQRDMALRARDGLIVDDIYRAVVAEQGATQWVVVVEADLPDDTEGDEAVTAADRNGLLPK